MISEIEMSTTSDQNLNCSQRTFEFVVAATRIDVADVRDIRQCHAASPSFFSDQSKLLTDVGIPVVFDQGDRHELGIRSVHPIK